MKSKTKRILAFLCAVVLVATTFLGNWYTKQAEVKAADSVEPISVDGFENVTISDFVDSNDNQMPEGEYPCTDATNGNNSLYHLKDGESLVGKMFAANVTFTSGTNTRIDFAGAGEWKGLHVYPHSAGSHFYIVSHSEYGLTSNWVTVYEVAASSVGLSSFFNTEFLLQITLELMDSDSDGASDDLKVGMYINGNACTPITEVIENCDTTTLGGHISMYRQAEGSIITASSVKWPAEPVQLKGFENLTLSDFTDSNGYSMVAGKYTAGSSNYFVSRLTTLDKTLFSTRITFHTGIESPHHSCLMIGGTETWDSLNICTNVDGTELYIEDTWVGEVNNYSHLPNGKITISAETAGVSAFVEDEFLLQLSFEYGEVDENNKAVLTLGVYIEGKLYDTYTISDWDMSHVGTNLCTYYEKGGITIENVNIRKEPVVVDGFENITIANFTDKSDGTGNVLNDGTYIGTNSYPYYLSGATDFNGKLLSMYVSFNGGGSYKNSITLAGKSDYSSFNIHPNDNAGTSLSFDTTWASSITSSSSVSVSASEAGVSSFVNNEFLLQVSFSYGEQTDGYADLTIGFYIDGKACGNYTIASCNMNNAGNSMSLISENDTITRSITVDDVEFGKFAGYTEVTVEDFVDASGNVMEEKAYTTTVQDAYDTFSLKDYDSFDKKKLALNVMFKYGGDNTRLHVAAVNGGWSGLTFKTNTEGTYLYVTSDHGYVTSSTPELPIIINKDDVSVSSFLNTKFLLEITFKYVSTNQIEMGIYINGVHINEQNYTLTVNTAGFGDYIGLYRGYDESAILIGSVNSDSFPVDMGIQPSYRYEKLTFGDFNIVNKTYPHISGDFAVSGTASERDTLDKTVIVGDVLLEGDKQFQWIWGGTSGWDGLRMFTTASSMQLTWYGSSTVSVGTLNSTTAGVDFVGEKYNIMLSAELVNHNGDDSASADDIKIGIWFNGVLYNQQYFYIDDEGAKLGDYFSVYCGDDADPATSSVTFGSKMDLLEQPSESLKKITFAQFGVDDGIYESLSDVNTKGTYVKGDTVNGTVLCGDVQLINSSAGEIHIFLGSTDNVWTQGIRLTVYGGSTDMNLIYQTPSAVNTIESFKPAVAGVDFTSEKFNLMWSMELVDSDKDGEADDLKVGVWFNGFLYQQEYEYITDFGADMLGNTFATYCASGTSIALNSMVEYAQRPNADFDRITFSDFGLETGEYVCGADVVASSKASAYNTFDRVVFSGDFRMKDDGTYQIIYGGDSGWSGLRFMIESDGSMNVYWYKGDEKQYVAYVTPEYAGVTSFTKNTFNLMVSTELVDDDGDGNKNDIKIGIWFNEVLYEYEGREYQVVKDWGDQLLNGFSIYSASGSATSVYLRNVGDYQKNPYYYEDISAYRGTTKTAPEAPTGYVFGGWYADAEYTEWIGTDVTSGSAWAKFLEDDVLSAKPQVKVDANQNIPTDSTDLRLATSVDNLLYRRISFFIAKEQSDGTYGSEFNTATTDENARLVYEKLYAIGDNSTTITYKPTAFSWQSDYFKTFTLTGIPSSDYGTMIKVTPYWITMDGTLVRGKVLETCVNDYTNNVSEAVSLDFIGDDTMPITGFNGPYVITNDDAMLFPDYITDEYFKMIADTGVNAIITNNFDYASYPDQMKKALALGEKYGVGIYVQDSKLKELSTEADVKARLAEYDSYESFVGIHLVDEPGTSSYKSDSTSGLVSEYTTLAGILNDLGIKTYANAFPIVDTTDPSILESIFGDQGIKDEDKENYTTYISELNSGLDPVALMWDYYPFAIKSGDRSTVVTEHSLYFWNMGEIRRQAQASNKPFWAYVQAGANWNDAGDYFDTQVYVTTEGQFKWNMNTALAFGAQGIQYFPLIQPYHFAYAGTSAEDKMWDFNRNGLIGAFGNKTTWYDYAVEANTHLGEIDGVLMDSYSKRIIAIGSAQSDTSGVEGVTTSAAYEELKSASGNALIGCFDYKGKTALYVVNYDYDNAGTVTLEFTETYDITRIENAVTTETSASSLTLDMEAGEGILLVLE